MEAEKRHAGGRLAWTDHKFVGLAYCAASLFFMLVAFGLVLMMRWQLAWPGEPLPFFARIFDANHPSLPGGAMQPTFYNQLGALHGTIMIFLAVAPVLVGGFGSYLVPLMIGAPNLAFPRISLLGLLAFLVGGLIMLGSFFAEGGPAATGWTAYPPLSSIETTGQTLWLLGVSAVYLSSLALAINLIATIVQLRAPGMTFMRLPFFVWSELVTAFLLLLAFPPLAAAAVLQLTDRLRGSSFFLPDGLVISGQPLAVSGGGSALLWQHLFWFLAHPEVYVLILPALGMVAEIYANNTRKPLWGHRSMVYAAFFLGFMSMLVWAHHMFLTGMGSVMNAFFQTTTVIVSVPSIVIGTSLLLSLWGGSIRFTVPMLFALAFLPMFAIGGLTGMPLAFASTNIPLHDTYYVIGHFHYVVAPGTIFAIFAAIYFWFPKISGRRMNDLLGHLHFWPTLLFMNCIFMPMIFQGLAGVNRRMYDGGATYAHASEVLSLNRMATVGAFCLAVAQLPFIANFFYSLIAGKRVDQNPWEATTLEWAAPSPPLANGNFPDAIAVHRGPNEYSTGEGESDYVLQNAPGEATS